jgi:hypothetical protein
MLNETKLIVAKETDGRKSEFGEVTIPNQTEQRAFAGLLGDCANKRNWTLALYRRAIQEGNANARILACRMAFFLLSEQDKPGLTPDDLNALAALAGAEEDLRVRNLAQWALGRLLLVSGDQAEKKLVLMTQDAEPDGKIELRATQLAGEKTWTVWWDSPATLSAWWKTWAAVLRWDDQRSRYLLIANS